MKITVKGGGYVGLIDEILDEFIVLGGVDSKGLDRQMLYAALEGEKDAEWDKLAFAADEFLAAEATDPKFISKCTRRNTLVIVAGCVMAALAISKSDAMLGGTFGYILTCLGSVNSSFFEESELFAVVKYATSQFENDIS